MSKYTETPLSAAAYQRCEKITIYNPYMAAPTVQFEEEQVIKRADNSILHDKVGTITMVVDDYTATFPVYDPTTQVKTGTTGTVAQLYAMIWSVYMHQAVLRDAYLAKGAVLQAFNVTDQANRVAAEAAAAATPESRDQIMADYEAAKVTGLAKAELDAQAVYDAIVAAG